MIQHPETDRKMTEASKKNTWRKHPYKIWLIVTTVSAAGGALAAVTYATTWFPYISGDCGVVRIYEQLFGVFILGAWIIGSTLGIGLVLYGYYKRFRTIIPGAIITVVACLGMISIQQKTIHDIREADYSLKSTPLLIQFLQGDDMDKRQYAAHELGERRAGEAVSVLCRILDKDKEYNNLKLNIIDALGKICTSPPPSETCADQAVISLIKALWSKKEYLPGSAAEALGRIGDARAVAPLLKLSQNTDWYTREAVIKSLASIDTEEAREAAEQIRVISSSKGPVETIHQGEKKVRFQGDVYDDGHTDVTIPSPSLPGREDLSTFAYIRKPELLWRYKAKDKFWYSSPLAHQGRVFYASRDCDVTCREALSGKQVWSFNPRSNRISYYFTTDGDYLFFGSDYGINALNMQSGSLAWRTRFEHMGTGCRGCIAGDLVVFSGVISQPVTAFHRKTGKKVWVSNIGPQMFTYLCAEDDIVCGMASNVVYALDAGTGKKIWSVQLPVSPDCYNPVILNHGKAFYVTPQGTHTAIVAREARTGNLLWETRAMQYVLETAGGGLTIAHGMVYGVMNELYALDKNTGNLIWYAKIGVKNGYSRPLSWPVVADKSVMIGTTYGIETFDAEKGAHLWEMKTGKMVYSRPAVHNGLLFFGCDDTYFYCLGYRD